MLLLDRVGKIYPNGVNELERFSAEIRQGEIVAIIGGSGSGKSTLLRCINLLEEADSGRMRIGDTRIEFGGRRIPVREQARLRTHVGMYSSSFTCSRT